MTLASLVLVIIRDIREIRGQILQPRISQMTRIIGIEHFRLPHSLMLRKQHGGVGEHLLHNANACLQSPLLARSTGFGYRLVAGASPAYGN